MGSNQLSLEAFLDSKWAACPLSRRSVTGYVVLLGSYPICWKRKKLSIVSNSSLEEECRAILKKLQK